MCIFCIFYQIHYYKSCKIWNIMCILEARAISNFYKGNVVFRDLTPSTLSVMHNIGRSSSIWRPGQLQTLTLATWCSKRKPKKFQDEGQTWLKIYPNWLNLKNYELYIPVKNMKCPLSKSDHWYLQFGNLAQKTCVPSPNYHNIEKLVRLLRS